MKKTISLFQRNYDGDRLCRDEIVRGAEWVLSGEGIATRKWDGTCCLIKDGCLYKRYDAKHNKPTPDGFIPAQDPDEKTGHWPGWLMVGDAPEDRWHKQAWENFDRHLNPDEGTYELIGPKINGNHERVDTHMLIKHGIDIVHNCPKIYPGRINDIYNNLKDFFRYMNEEGNTTNSEINSDIRRPLEGIVWHHPDGRMVKIKAKDLGIKWGR